MNKQYKVGKFEKSAIIGEVERTIQLSFASEEPYERWEGMEIVRVRQGMFDLTRLNDGAPLLFNHNCDMHLGTVVKAWIDADNVARAIVKFGKGEFATEKWNDVLDGILMKVSYMYEVISTNQIDQETYEVTKSKSYEISLVTIPADNTVGVGKSVKSTKEKETVNIDAENIASAENTAKIVVDTATVDAQNIPTTIIAAEVASTETTIEQKAIDDAKLEEIAKEIINKKAKDQENFDNSNKPNYNKSITIQGIKKMEANKTEIIGATLAAFPQYREQAVAEFLFDNSKSGADFKEFVRSSEAKKQNAQDAHIGGAATKRQYDFNAALRSLVSGERCFETEVSDELRKQSGSSSNGKGMRSILVPYSMLGQTRAYNATTTANLTETKLEGFIDPLFANMVTTKLGVQTMTGLQGVIKIPKMASGSTPAYIDSNSADTAQTSGTFTQIALDKNTLSDGFILNHDAILNPSYDVSALGYKDSLRRLAQKIDRDILVGTSPVVGVANTSGIGSIDFAGNADYGLIASLKGSVEGLNAYINDGNFKYVTTPQALAKMRTIARSGSNNGFIVENNMIDGDNIYGTSVMPIATGAHSLLAGDFSQVQTGYWNAIEIIVDPYSLSKRAAVQFSMFIDWGMAVRNASSFVLVDDMTIV